MNSSKSYDEDGDLDKDFPYITMQDQKKNIYVSDKFLSHFFKLENHVKKISYILLRNLILATFK